MCEKLSGKSAPSSSSGEGAALGDVRIGLHMRFTAALCREILKLGQSKKEKALGKEYLRLLHMQELVSWVRSDSVSACFPFHVIINMHASFVVPMNEKPLLHEKMSSHVC